MKGYIKLYRQITENSIWLLKPFSEGQAWIDLLCISTFDKGFIKTKNGQIIELEKGDCGYSMLSLSNRWGWSRGKVKRFILLLEKQQMIQQKIYGKHTIINILNYSKYQNDTTNSTTNDTTNDTTNGQQMIQQTDTIKNDKNDKNDKNNIVNILDTKKFKKPTLKEIEAYCIERKNNVDARYFYDYYESCNWMRGKTRMKDWKATIRTWERNTVRNRNSKTETKEIDGWNL